MRKAIILDCLVERVKPTVKLVAELLHSLNHIVKYKSIENLKYGGGIDSVILNKDQM